MLDVEDFPGKFVMVPCILIKGEHYQRILSEMSVFYPIDIGRHLQVMISPLKRYFFVSESA